MLHQICCICDPLFKMTSLTTCPLTLFEWRRLFSIELFVSSLFCRCFLRVCWQWLELYVVDYCFVDESLKRGHDVIVLCHWWPRLHNQDLWNSCVYFTAYLVLVAGVFTRARSTAFNVILGQRYWHLGSLIVCQLACMHTCMHAFTVTWSYTTLLTIVWLSNCPVAAMVYMQPDVPVSADWLTMGLCVLSLASTQLKIPLVFIWTPSLSKVFSSSQQLNGSI
jgi:hypothetical protein